MARRKPAKKRAKKVAKKSARKPAKKVAKKPARKPVKKAARKAAKRAPARRPAPAPAPAAADRRNSITHTELASADPPATQAWCEKVLGWSFMPPMPMPDGDYRMWRFAIGTGGGLRGCSPQEMPGSVPYCEVASIHATFAAAVAGGASEVMPPMELPGGMGWVAVVAAPGGVAIGFWAEK